MTALHVCATTILLVILTWGDVEWSAEGAFDPLIESAKWALRFLLLCLAITPLASYLGWTTAVSLRRPLGLWAFAFALVHVGYSLAQGDVLARWRPPIQPLFLLGGLSLAILTVLALTSMKSAQQRLGRAWKRLHRLVYLGGAATVTHALLAAATSKRMFVRDPQAVYEARLALALLAVLLIVRIPAVRRRLLPIFAPLRRPRSHDRPVPDPAPIPGFTPVLPVPSPPAAEPERLPIPVPEDEIAEEEAIAR
jgi:sulfoxide reductase heme-binding subunit YedZ